LKPMQEADKWFSLLMRYQACCIICSKAGYPDKDGLRVKGLELHHLLPKSVYPQFRYTVLNCVVVDTKHHLGVNLFPETKEDYIFAHMEDEVDEETGEIVDNRFMRFLRAERYDNWKFVKDNRFNHRDRAAKIDYKLLAETFKEEFHRLIEAQR